MPIQVTTTNGAAQRQAQSDAGARAIGESITLTQALAYITSNVTNLATALPFLKELTKEIILLRNDRNVMRQQIADLQARLTKGGL